MSAIGNTEIGRGYLCSVVDIRQYEYQFLICGFLLKKHLKPVLFFCFWIIPTHFPLHTLQIIRYIQNNETLFVNRYNTYGNLTAVYDEFNNMTSYTYDTKNRLINLTDRNGNETAYEYNNRDMLTVTQTSEYKYTYVYDAAGRNTDINKLGIKPGVDFNSIIGYNYTINGLVNEETTIYEKITGREATQINSVTFSTLYNHLNVPEKRIFKDESNPNIAEEEIFALDNMNRTTQITKGNSDVEYTYYKNGLIKTETLPNGIISTYEYDGVNRLENLTQKNANGELLKKYEYTYDPNGNQTSVTEILPEGNETVVSYTYNALNMLISENNGYDGSITEYSYDYRGNRTQKSILKDSITTQINYTYDSQNSDENFSRRIIAEKKINGALSETAIYNFDPSGSMIKKTVKNSSDETLEETEYHWDSIGMLESVHITGNGNNDITHTDYEYDAAGRRRKKSVRSETIESIVTDTTSYIWCGENVYKEEALRETVDSFISKNNSNFWGLNGLIKRNENIYTTNEKGDVSEKYIGDEKEKSYYYDAFGNEKILASDDETPYRYRGENYDKESGLIYLRARYYDPELGRFISEDTHWNIENMIYGDENTGVPNISAIMQSANLYVYCMNNPVMWTDKFGMNAYDHFDSERDAVEDWAYNYYAQSDYVRFEWASMLFKRKEHGKWYYSYTWGEHSQTPHNTSTVRIETYVPKDAITIGAIHSHPCVGEKYNNFSEADKKYAKNNNIKIYMVFRDLSVNDYKVSIKKWDARRGDIMISSHLNCAGLSSERKEYLKNFFVNSWGSHILWECSNGFNCPNLSWPNEMVK